MIALLGCSINLYANDNLHPSTGQLDERSDSVLIAYDDLRIVNSKLIELDYQREINTKLKEVIANDSIIIADYTAVNIAVKEDYNRTVKQRDIAIGVGFAAIISTILLSIFK